jgi:hypothetical protein
VPNIIGLKQRFVNFRVAPTRTMTNHNQTTTLKLS